MNDITYLLSYNGVIGCAVFSVVVINSFVFLSHN